MNYTFVDGSGNKYKLHNFKLSYEPISPEMSSSGTYSGGEPFSVELEKMYLLKFIDVMERALWAESDHTENKSMGSGTIIKAIGPEVMRMHLKYNSDSMKIINEVINEIKSNLAD